MADNTDYLLRQILEELKNIKNELTRVREDLKKLDDIKSETKEIERKLKK